MTEPARGTQAVDRAANLVATVVQADEPLSFADLHEECGLAKSTTSRLLTALERTELLERDDNGCYVAGPLFWLYAARHDPWDELVRLARPTMEKVGAATLETVNLAVTRGDRVVQVGQVDSQYMLGTRDWTEVEVPAHCSALGKVLYAHRCLPLPQRRLDQLTPHSIADRDELARQLGQVLRRGWAVTVDELEIGLCGVAVPVRGAGGEVVAALGVSGPTPRLEKRIAEFGGLLADHAEQLSELLHRRKPKEGVA
ncbi:MAG TPA: IclR family transcriptional regulator [Marmoricola sp.]